MILFEITRTENRPAYQALEIGNGNRQYDFIRSIVEASLAVGRPVLSQDAIKAFNFQAITCLHTNPGEYRPCPVHVGHYQPPEHYRVGALMDDFVNDVNRNWTQHDPVVLVTYVLWKINHIHPFINGNGRTARAAYYYVICIAAGGMLSGENILPELLRRNRDEYVEALKVADAAFAARQVDIADLHALVSRLLDEQLQSAPPPPPEELTALPPPAEAG